MLLWKPTDYDWESDGLRQMVRQLDTGLSPRASWSVNNFPRKIQAGHRVFLRRVSDAPLGVIGEGVVSSDVYWALSYKENDDRDLPYVDIDWVALSPFDPLPPDALTGRVKAATHRWASAIYKQDELDVLDEAWQDHLGVMPAGEGASLPRTTRVALREERTFQGRFRRLVLDAHGARCMVCGLDEVSILDAAHLVPHADGGLPAVENGRPLCANHHRAFDRGLLDWSREANCFEWVDPGREF